MLLANGSRWGVWAVEFVFMFTAALLGFGLIRRAFGVLPAIYATVAWMVNAFVTMDGGNYTTEYALPLQFGLLWLVATASGTAVSVRRAFVLGILSGLLFWLKQNDIGIPLSIALLFVLDFLRGQRGASVCALAAMTGGALLTSALVIFPFLAQGALASFWEAAFLYNLDYIEETWFDRLVTLRVLPITLPASGLVTYGFVGWLIATLVFLNGFRRGGSVWVSWSDTLGRLWGERTDNYPCALNHGQVVRLMTLVILALPLECFLVVLPGNTFDHYFLALLPVLAVFAAFTFRLMLSVLERASLARRVQVAFVVALLVVSLAFAVEYVQPIFSRLATRNHDLLISYIVQNTRANDTVVIWGGEGRINFESKRVNPTRFVYLSPLRRNAPNGSAYTREMLGRLQANPPDFLVDMASSTLRVLEFAIADPEFARAGQELLSRYRIRETNDDWTMYEYRRP